MRLALALLLAVAAFGQQLDTFDTVILHGRVIDPESHLDAVRNVGIRGGKIVAVTADPIRGKNQIEANGLVVSPGFIDIHAHGQDLENSRLQAADGVTTAMEIEIGVADIDKWYAEREGKRVVNYGASIGHVPARMQVLHDPSTGMMPTGSAMRDAATPEQISEMQHLIDHGLRRGAVAVGFGLQYVPGASRWEIIQMFRTAAQHGASCHVHMRNAGNKDPGAVMALEEVLAAAEVTGAPLHVVHITSTGLRSTPQLLDMIASVRKRGQDVTTECYPYTAGMTYLESAIFNPGWQEANEITYKDLQWAATGERLTAETFEKYRKQGGLVAIHSIPEEIARLGVASPYTIIASDGILTNGKGHPRTAGTYSRTLGRYVREQHALSLNEAIEKMTLWPAQRLQHLVPMMANKGRIRVGADADITVFNPTTVIDRATYEQPTLPPAGISWVFVNGAPVIKNGVLQTDILPGRPVRGVIQ